MKTFVGVDYHKGFSYGAIMDERGEILKSGRFGNHADRVAEFLGGGLDADVMAAAVDPKLYRERKS